MKSSYTSLPGFLKANGYSTFAAGKIHHRSARSSTEWDEGILLESKQTAHLKEGGPFDESDFYREVPQNYRPTVKPLEKHRDHMVASFGVEVLARERAQPFFLAVGLHKPHLPFNAPRQIFDLYPREVQPPRIHPDDLDDIPAVGHHMATAMRSEENNTSRISIYSRYRFQNEMDFSENWNETMTNEWTKPEHVEAYLARMKDIPHRVEGESTLLSEVPVRSKRVLDLGCGNGHLLDLVLAHCPDATGVGLDFSPTMLTPEDEDPSNKLLDVETQLRSSVVVKNKGMISVTEMIIRKERPADVDAIAEVTIAAFKDHLISEQTEHFIVDALRTADALVEANMELYEKVGFVRPWVSYIAVDDDVVVGSCDFKSPPVDGRVEIAYFTFPGNEGQGIATSMASEVVRIANAANATVLVIAQTLPEENASTAVLKKLGFQLVGPVDHPEDGTVWEWVLATRRCRHFARNRTEPTTTEAKPPNCMPQIEPPTHA